MKHVWKSTFKLCLILIGCAIIGCDKKPEPGFLRVNAPGAGSYDVYRIASENPLQFVSEQVGNFNENLALMPGSYLVMADCSAETVIVYPDVTQTMTIHQLEFVPPRTPGPSDSFSIQCNRSDKTKSRQHILNRYSLNLLHGQRDLLVGMVPLHINFKSMQEPEVPKVITHKLSALQVADFDPEAPRSSYFVSPVNELIAATKSQTFGHWDFLLPGAYWLEVNGTRMQVTLSEAEERVIQPAFLKISTSDKVNLALPAKVRGMPSLVEINQGHTLNFNETYPVLPGEAEVQVSGSSQVVKVSLVEGQLTELKAKSVMVNLKCEPEDWSCLGNKDVSLYLENNTYPFIESISDIPILYIDTGKKVLVGVDGSREIFYQLPMDSRDVSLKLGFVKLIPIPTHKPPLLTDLVRVESAQPSFQGSSLDINHERPTLMPLIAGSYHLAHYTSNIMSEGDRRKANRVMVVEAGHTIDVEFQTFLGEKKYALYKKREEAERHERRQAAPSSDPSHTSSF